MAKVAITEQYLTDIADAIRTKTGMSSATYLPSQMAPAIMTISGSGGITPTGTISITENGTHNVTQYASASVAVPNSYGVSDEGKVVSNGALVAQTSATYNSNNTYDTTTIGSITVSVPINNVTQDQNGYIVIPPTGNSGGGGGGSNDFTTAEVTIVPTGGSFFNLDLDTNEYYGYDAVFYSARGFEHFASPTKDESNLPLTTTFTLYFTGNSIEVTPYNVVESCEGNASYDSETGKITITGNCTITGYTND